MNKKIGFIGCGNMGRAMVAGLLSSKTISPEQVIVSTKTVSSGEEIKKQWNVLTTTNNKLVAKEAQIIFLAVNPNQYEEVIKEVKDEISSETIIILIAAGISLKTAEYLFGKEVKIVKTMPNTPALVGEGMSAICANSFITEKELATICELYESFGKYELLDEEEFHAFIALCGSSPAYIFVLIEAMADAAVKMGISREKAYRMAEQSILGSAKLALETNEHPAKLKDMVCSPGGSTIEAIVELEKKGFRQSIMAAMEVCAEKSIRMQEMNE